MKNFAVLGGEKTKPIQSQFKAKQAGWIANEGEQTEKNR